MVYLRYLIVLNVLCETAICGTVTENSVFKLRTTILDTQHIVNEPHLDKENEGSSSTRKYWVKGGILRTSNSMEKKSTKSSEIPIEGSRNGRRIIFTRYNCPPGFYADGRGRCREL